MIWVGLTDPILADVIGDRQGLGSALLGLNRQLDGGEQLLGSKRLPQKCDSVRIFDGLRLMGQTLATHEDHGDFVPSQFQLRMQFNAGHARHANVQQHQARAA
jgi:hypothetical protein